MNHRLAIVLGIIIAATGLGLTQWVRSDLANRPAAARQEAWEVGPRVIEWNPKPDPPSPAGVRDVMLENPEKYFGPSTPKRHTPRWKIAATGWVGVAAGLGVVGVGLIPPRRRSA